ncbi:reverse transcriptase domain-containing protein, partial [Tanacetum coccineum]
MSRFMASQDAKMSLLECEMKQQLSEMTNKFDMMLKAMNDRSGALPTDTIKNPRCCLTPRVKTPKDLPQPLIRSNRLNHASNLLLAFGKECHKEVKDPRLFILPWRLGDSKPFDTLADLWSNMNLIPLCLYRTLNIGLLEGTNSTLVLADGSKAYSIGLVRNVEVQIGALKLLDDFYVVDMKQDPTCPL